MCARFNLMTELERLLATPRRTGPLAGVRVLDLTAVVLGPLAIDLKCPEGAAACAAIHPRLIYCVATGMALANAILAALFEPAHGPAGYARLLAGGRKPAPTLDSHMALLPDNGQHWHNFLMSAGRQDLAEQYAGNDRHHAHPVCSGLARSLPRARHPDRAGGWLCRLRDPG